MIPWLSLLMASLALPMMPSNEAKLTSIFPIEQSFASAIFQTVSQGVFCEVVA
jgi:hypothetical protein